MTRWATLATALLLSAIATVQYTGTASGQGSGGWTVLFDGKKTAEANNGLWEEGHIALQFGVGVVKFRKIEIKEL